MPSVTGIIETALYAADLAATVEFYRRVFGFGTLLESERLVALSVADRDVLLLFKQGATDEPFTTEGGVLPGHSGSGPSHFAFAVTAGEVDGWREHLGRLQVPIESVVTWPGGAKSIYFRDPDRHAVELLTPGFWAIY